jgi:LysM repeat protein
VNKRSHNLLADHVLKALGRVVEGEGSYEGGARAVGGFLSASVGVDTSHVSVYDGSGLSPLNRVSAADFVALMAYMAEQGDWDAFWRTLPEAGNPRELRRMSRTAAAGHLRAKTGTIRNVSALTGVVTTTSGERIAFSIISNSVPSTGSVKAVEDRIGSRLAAFARPATAELGPATAPVLDGGSSDADEPAVATRASGNPRANEGPAPAALDGNPGSVPPATHRVTAGDNFTLIARRYRVEVNALLEANPQLSPRRLRIGTLVSIPTRPARP